ncbi:MAG TPA: sulfotransferase [Solirubrobacteraceae bacterium]|nr:sulfotransferase [Solirubrobacteraceae bacterium]
MRLIGAGLPRTGTLTQKVALETLGFEPCYHWVNVIADLEQVGVWDKAIDGDVDWNAVFAGFQASVDWPGGYFWRELMDHYPDAKVLLSVRNAEKWEPSFRETIWNMCFGGSVLNLVSRARAQVDPQWDRYLKLVERMFWGPQGTFAAGHETPAQMIAQFEAHNELVKANVPSDRLLVWSVTEGWEPLCEFLEVPAPAEPLPHVNDRETFLGRVIDGALGKLGEWRAAETAALSSAAA